MLKNHLNVPHGQGCATLFFLSKFQALLDVGVEQSRIFVGIQRLILKKSKHRAVLIGPLLLNNNEITNPDSKCSGKAGNVGKSSRRSLAKSFISIGARKYVFLGNAYKLSSSADSLQLIDATFTFSLIFSSYQSSLRFKQFIRDGRIIAHKKLPLVAISCHEMPFLMSFFEKILFFCKKSIIINVNLMKGEKK